MPISRELNEVLNADDSYCAPQRLSHVVSHAVSRTVSRTVSRAVSHTAAPCPPLANPICVITTCVCFLFLLATVSQVAKLFQSHDDLIRDFNRAAAPTPAVPMASDGLTEDTPEGLLPARMHVSGLGSVSCHLAVMYCATAAGAKECGGLFGAAPAPSSGGLFGAAPAPAAASGEPTPFGATAVAVAPPSLDIVLCDGTGLEHGASAVSVELKTQRRKQVAVLCGEERGTPVGDWLSAVCKAGFAAAIITSSSSALAAAREMLVSAPGESPFCVLLASEGAVLQLVWAVTSLERHWDAQPAAPLVLEQSYSHAELCMRGESLGLPSAEARRHVDASGGNDVLALGSLVSAALAWPTLRELGLGAPVDHGRVPWLVVTLAQFIGDELGAVAQRSVEVLSPHVEAKGGELGTANRSSADASPTQSVLDSDHMGDDSRETHGERHSEGCGGPKYELSLVDGGRYAAAMERVLGEGAFSMLDAIHRCLVKLSHGVSGAEHEWAAMAKDTCTRQVAYLLLLAVVAAVPADSLWASKGKASDATKDENAPALVGTETTAERAKRAKGTAGGVAENVAGERTMWMQSPEELFAAMPSQALFQYLILRILLADAKPSLRVGVQLDVITAKITAATDGDGDECAAADTASESVDFVVGDRVRVRDVKPFTAADLLSAYGGLDFSMCAMLGKQGTVRAIHSDGSVSVAIDGIDRLNIRKWNPLLLQPLSSTQVQRSSSTRAQLRVEGAGGVGCDCNGVYAIDGECNSRPKYKKVAGEAIIYFDNGWKMNDDDSILGWFYSMDSRSSTPPVGRWTNEGYMGGDCLPCPFVALVEQPPVTCSSKLPVQARLSVGSPVRRALCEQFGKAFSRSTASSSGNGADVPVVFFAVASSLYGALRRHATNSERATHSHWSVPLPSPLELAMRTPTDAPSLMRQSSTLSSAASDDDSPPDPAATGDWPLLMHDMTQLEAEAVSGPCDAQPGKLMSALKRMGQDDQYCYERCLSKTANEQTKAVCALADSSRCVWARLTVDSATLQPPGDLERTSATLGETMDHLPPLPRVHLHLERLRALLTQSSHSIAAQLLIHRPEPLYNAFIKANVCGPATWAGLLQRLLLTTGPETVAQLTSLASQQTFVFPCSEAGQATVQPQNEVTTRQRSSPDPLLALSCCLLLEKSWPMGPRAELAPSAQLLLASQKRPAVEPHQRCICWADPLKSMPNAPAPGQMDVGSVMLDGGSAEDLAPGLLKEIWEAKASKPEAAPGSSKPEAALATHRQQAVLEQFLTLAPHGMGSTPAAPAKDQDTEPSALLHLGAWLLMRHLSARKPGPIEVEPFELLCAHIGKSERLRHAVLPLHERQGTPNTMTIDGRLVLRCLASVIESAEHLRTSISPLDLLATGPVDSGRSAPLRLWQVPAPALLRPFKPLHPLLLQAQALPLLRVIAIGEASQKSMVPSGWSAASRAMQLLRASILRPPPAPEKLSAGGIDADPLWDAVMDAQLVQLAQALCRRGRTPRDHDRLVELLPLKLLKLEDFQVAATEVLPNNGLYHRIQQVAPPALMHRHSELITFNTAIFRDLIPWVDLSESSSTGSLANDLCKIGPLIYECHKRTLFTSLVKATKSSNSTSHEVTFDKREATRAAARATTHNTAVADATTVSATVDTAATGDVGASAATSEGVDAAAAAAAQAHVPEAAAARAHAKLGGDARVEPRTMFEQFADAVAGFRSERQSALRELNCGEERSFSVRFSDEGGIDQGGPYREALDELVVELHSKSSALLILTPNSSQLGEEVYDRGKYMLNPAPPGQRTLWLLEVFGALIGMGLRQQMTLPFELALPVWRGILGQTPTLAEYELVNKAETQRIVRIRDNCDPNCANMPPDVFDAVYGEIVDFTIPRSDMLAEVQLKPGGKSEGLTYASRLEWAALAEAYLLHECDVHLAAIRSGLSQIVPLEALVLFSAVELERLVVGPSAGKDWSVADLRAGAEIRGRHQSIDDLFEVLGELTPDEKALFTRFAWGRSRLPADCRGVKLIVESTHSTGDPDSRLPVSHTCFFQVDLPQYTSKEKLREKLLYAIYNCKDMDLA